MDPTLNGVLDRFAGRRILLVGDFMLDRYIFGDAERISPEAPVPVLRVVDEQDRVGGAGSVALNIRALGAEVECFGVLGQDAAGERVLHLLTEAGAGVAGLARSADRPTITKTRLVGLAEHRHRQQLARIDREVTRPLAAAAADELLRAATARLDWADVVCLEDYRKGVITPESAGALIAQARRRNKPVLVDPARTNWDVYRGATLLTPNRAEFEHGAGRSLADDALDATAAEQIARLDLDALIITLGRDGARLVARERPRAARVERGASAEPPGAAPPGVVVRHFPTRPRAVYDNTGAGDAVLAMVAVALAAGASLDEAVPLANIAGGLEVSKFGCVPISAAEVRDELLRGHDAGRRKIRPLGELLEELAARRNRGETVVFTNGVFDLLHPGHVELLERAKALGSMLIVGMNSDASARSQGKGDDRPIRSQEVRARMLAALEAVDYVVMFDDPSVLATIERVAPDVLVKGGDYTVSQVVGHEVVQRRGGKVVVAPFVHGFSTTGELAAIRAVR